MESKANRRRRSVTQRKKEEEDEERRMRLNARASLLPPSKKRQNFESWIVPGGRKTQGRRRREGGSRGKPCQVSEARQRRKLEGWLRSTYKAWNGTESRVGVVRGAIRSRYTRRHLRNGIPVPYKTGSNKEERSATANRRILDTLRSPREISSSNCIASSLEKGIAQPSIRRLVCDDEKNQNRTIIF